MPYQITFDKSCEYNSLEDGVTIPVVLKVGATKADLLAKVDTGAAHCLFQREYGEALGLQLENGQLVRLDTLAGSLTAFGHEVTLITFDIEFEAIVFFAADYNLPRNLLGRSGWLQKVRMGLIDYESRIYLSAYSSPLQ
ncbi:MAG: hypothetical protein U0Z53_16075 [Blastocatellia bacterium]